MANDERMIRQLLKRFMNGRTTVEEEERISQWFKNNPAVGEDLEPYRKMFAWFEDGMEPGAIENVAAKARQESAGKSKRRLWLYAASVAVFIVLSATLYFSRIRQDLPTDVNGVATLRYSPRHRGKEHVAGRHIPDSGSPTEIKPTSGYLQKSRFSLPLAQGRAEPTKPGFCYHKKSSALQAPHVVPTDSLLKEGEQMVGVALAEMEAEQQQFLSEFDNDVSVADSVMTAMLQYGLAEPEEVDD